MKPGARRAFALLALGLFVSAGTFVCWTSFAPAPKPPRSVYVEASSGKPSSRATSSDGDAIDRALDNIDSTNETRSDGASRVLENSDGAALERVLAALRQPRNEIVRDRLESLLPRLRLDASRKRFEEICRSQWSLCREHAVVVAVRHRTAELVRRSGLPAWTFAEEIWRREAATVKPSWGRYVVKTWDNLEMTPLEGELQFSNATMQGNVAWRCKDGSVSTRRVVLGRSPKFFEVEGGSFRLKIPDLPQRHIVAEWTLDRVLERATIAGLKRVAFTYVFFLEPEPFVLTTAYECGAPPRKKPAPGNVVWQRNSGYAYGKDEEFEISPEKGLVDRRNFMDLERWASSGWEISDEATCAASGIIPDGK